MPKYPKKSIRSILNAQVWWFIHYRAIRYLPIPMSLVVFGAGVLVGVGIVLRFVPCP